MRSEVVKRGSGCREVCGGRAERAGWLRAAENSLSEHFGVDARSPQRRDEAEEHAEHFFQDEPEKFLSRREVKEVSN